MKSKILKSVGCIALVMVCSSVMVYGDTGLEYSDVFQNTEIKMNVENDKTYTSRINNYINMDKVVKLNNHLYVVGSYGIEKMSEDLSHKETISNTSGALRIYEVNGQIYYLVNDGIKILNENGEDTYLYSAEGFKPKYCQLINDKFYFLEYGVYIEWVVDTSMVIKPTVTYTNALRSINVDGSGAKTYYYNDAKPIKDDDGIIQLKIETKVISMNDDQRFIVLGNTMYTKNKIYNLVLMDEDISFTAIVSGINFDSIVGYSNEKFYCSSNGDFYEMSLGGTSKLISEGALVRGVFEFEGKTYVTGSRDVIYQLIDSGLQKLGYITNMSEVYSAGGKFYSLDNTFSLMNVNLGGNAVTEVTDSQVINANNKRYSVNYVDFCYDGGSIYISKGSEIEQWDRDLNSKKVLQYNDDTKKNIQRYFDSIIYNDSKAIKQIFDSGKEKVLYTSPYTIHKSEEAGGYVYFSETSSYYSRIGRVNIESGIIEYLINGNGWRNSSGNSDFIAKSFMVLNNRIFYNANNSIYEVFSYDIKRGISTKVEGISHIGDIKLVDENNIYIVKDNKLKMVNIETHEEVEVCDASSGNIERLFKFNGKLYNIYSGLDIVSEITNDGMKDLGFISGASEIYSTGDRIYSGDKTFSLMNINLGGNEVSKMTASNIINANNKIQSRASGDFSYDDKFIYMSKGSVIEKWDKDITKKEELPSSSDLKKDIQKYKDSIIYNDGKAIKKIDMNGKEQVLYSSSYTIHKSEETGGYVYFSETSSYYTRIGRVKISTGTSEYLINDIGWRNNSGNSDYIAKSFIVLDNKIFYNVNNNKYEVYCYDIGTGTSMKISGISNIGNIKLINRNNIYLNVNNKIQCLDVETNERRELNYEGNLQFSMFEFKGNVYIIDYDKAIYKVGSSIEKLGYINSNLRLVSDETSLYTYLNNKLVQVNTFIKRADSKGIEGIGKPGSKITVKSNNNKIATQTVGADGKINIKLDNLVIGTYIRIYTTDSNGVEGEYIELEIADVQPEPNPPKPEPDPEPTPEFEKEDIDKNGVVDILDLAQLAVLYGVDSDSENWNSSFDLNEDGIIDIYDLVLVSKKLKSK